MTPTLPADPAALWTDETVRRREFPVCAEKVFLAHAAVCAIPRVAAQAEADFAWGMTTFRRSYDEILRDLRRTREAAARFLPGALPEEIALLGPTSLGLSQVAGGLPWRAGDEVIYYGDDYPANVYPWTNLAETRGVVPVALQPLRPGEITPELVSAALTPRTRLVALASASFLAGYRPDVDAIGARLRARGVLFCVDAIQTMGAFPIPVANVDFLAADAHKWLLGPLAAGVLYVKREHFARLRPILFGTNARAPDFVPLEGGRIELPDDARRYESGVLNCGPLAGMRAAMDLLLAVGPERVAARIAGHVARLAGNLGELGFEFLGPTEGPNASGILTASHPHVPDGRELVKALEAERSSASPRRDRSGRWHVRFSPHFYNVDAELDHAVAVVRQALG